MCGLMEPSGVLNESVPKVLSTGSDGSQCLGDAVVTTVPTRSRRSRASLSTSPGRADRWQLVPERGGRGRLCLCSAWEGVKPFSGSPRGQGCRAGVGDQGGGSGGGVFVKFLTSPGLFSHGKRGGHSEARRLSGRWDSYL